MSQPNGIDMWDKIVMRFAVPLLTASLGFGISQFFAVQTLRDRVLYNTQHLDTVDRVIEGERVARADAASELRKQVTEARDQLARDTQTVRESTDKRIENITRIMEQILKQDFELIQTMKLQQNLRP